MDNVDWLICYSMLILAAVFIAFDALRPELRFTFVPRERRKLRDRRRFQRRVRKNFAAGPALRRAF